MRKNLGVKPYLYPQLVMIIGTYDKDGKPNAMNAAWGGMADYDKVVVCISFSTSFWLLSIVAPKALVSIFTTDQELIVFASKALRIYFAVICMFGIQIACQQTFVSLGNAPVSLFLAIFRKIIVLIPLIYILPAIMENKCDAIFLAEPIADFIAVSVTATMFYFVFKKSMKEIG